MAVPEIDNEIAFLAAAITASILLLVFISKWWGERKRRRAVETRFKPVLDVDAELARLLEMAETSKTEIEKLRADYKEKKSVYDRLVHEIAIFDERLAFAELGVYEPHFDFNDSEAYKTAIKDIREKQKALVSNKTAVICTTQWTVDGSKSKGQTLTNRNIRLTLRAFNNECDVAIANTRWNNVNAMETRIIRAFEQINKMNASNAVVITDQHLKLKLQELYLTHEYREQLKKEREERAEAARMAREEEKLMRDMERAQQDEEHYQKLLQKARAEAASVAGAELQAFKEQIEVLERDLAEAHEKYARAQAMAEKTKSGYVYIVSNEGSFGPDMVKIGLTRRLDPDDRVRELGDASVPFTFDTHAMIYSDDAPALERSLHAKFEESRVNLQNYRKEFFRVSINDVEEAVKKLAPEANFFRDVEAQEYRETIARRNAALQAETHAEQAAFPAAI